MCLVKKLLLIHESRRIFDECFDFRGTIQITGKRHTIFEDVLCLKIHRMGKGGRLIHHIAIGTENPEELARFYRAIFGYEVILPPGEDRGSVWLRTGSGTILMFEKAHRIDERDPEAFHIKQCGYHLIAFQIEKSETDEWLQKLKNLEISVEERSQYSIYFRDPEGNRIALSSYKPDS